MKTKERGANKLPRIRLRNTRMLCPQGCGTMQAEFQNERNLVYLSCKHLRTPGLLDPAPGHLSIEAVMANDRTANRLFPATDRDGFKRRGLDLTDIISDEVEALAIRDRCAA